MNSFSIRRAGVVFISLAILFVVLTGRVAYLQTLGRQKTIAKAERQQHQTTTLPARRQGIFDRNGFAFALTVQKQDLFVDPHFIQEFEQDPHNIAVMDEAIDKLAAIIDRQPLELAQQINDRNCRFLPIAKDLDEAQIAEIQKLKIPGLGFVPSYTRSYPMGNLAAHILGGVGKDGHGLEGIELRFDKLLAGKDGWERKLKDAQRRAIGVDADDYLSPQHGQSLMLTIDANIQMIAEQELALTCQDFHAKCGEIVVMDPNSGEVLALANWPTFDPNSVELVKDNKLRLNRALIDPYEPGSTIKPFIVGAALQTNQTQLTELWTIPGIKYTTPYGRTITDTHSYGNLVTWDVLVKSSNIGMSKLGERMGNERLHTALGSWGFGRPTGIELPAEGAGKLKPLPKWSKYTTESVSTGYEVMITPLQLCRAFCAYANGGKLVQPTIVRGLLDSDGKVVSKATTADFGVLPQVLTPETAQKVRDVLCDVPIRGTAHPFGHSDIWNIFGKTGTAHISENGRYSSTKYTSSFVCGAPAENPRLVVAFIVHQPDAEIAYYGGAVTAPGAKRVIERSLTYLQVPPSPELQPPPPNISNLLWNFNAKAYKRKINKTQTASNE